ncbi:MAG: RC-LH1 core complex protein PufX [Pseudomonadota bacterium]
MATNENHPITHQDTTPQLIRFEIVKQMLKGSGVAAGVLLLPAAFIFCVHLVGTLLPPESKEAVDPTPDSFVVE